MPGNENDETHEESKANGDLGSASFPSSQLSEKAVSENEHDDTHDDEFEYRHGEGFQPLQDLNQVTPTRKRPSPLYKTMSPQTRKSLTVCVSS